MTNCLTTTALCQSDKCSVTTTEQRCVLTISVPLEVGEAPFENSWWSYEIKNVTQKKLVLFGTFRWIPYMHKIWSLSTMNNLPVQDQAKVVFWADAKIEDFNFKNKKSHVDKSYSFQLFVHFSTDSESPEFKFFESGFKYSYMFT